MIFDSNAIPVLSRDVIARKDRNGVLLFQVCSDEMYFVDAVAYEAFIAGCDGSKTLGEITAASGIDTNAAREVEKLDCFVESLVQRKIITLW